MNIHYDLFVYIGWSLSAVLLVFLMLCSIYYLIFWSISGKPVKPAPHSDEKSKFAVLIAARNESNVIRNIFNSLKEQTYDPNYFDVWVIVEDEKDPTCEIAKEFGYHYFVRDQLTEQRKTKGFALQECINYFWRSNIEYDAYMIFDADNVMDNDFIEKMNDVRQTGVKVGIGYRNFTNANTNWLTIGSAIMFDYMNQITSKGRSLLFHKATLMGTGYFVDSSIIKDIGEWIFTGMTEDIQLTTYCYYHDIYMRYYPLVSFYDEQSAEAKIVHMQHLRWVYGYFERRTFLKKAGIKYDYHTKGMQSFMRFEFNAGLIPFVIYHVCSLLLGIAAIVIGSLAVVEGADPVFIGMSFGLAGLQMLLMYVSFMIPAIIVLYRDNKYIKLTKGNVLKGVLTYYFYFMDFPAAIIDGFFHPEKRRTWKVVKHEGEITNEDAKKVS